MIEILSTEYIAEVDWTMYKVKFTHEDYRIILDGKFDGSFTENELIENLQPQYNSWINRIG